MKKIVTYLKDYIFTELKPLYLLSIALFIGLYIYIEYSYGITDEINLNNLSKTGYFISVVLHFLLPFSVAWLLYSFFYNDFKIWRNPQFWFLILFASIVFSSRSILYFFTYDIYKLLPDGRTEYFFFRCTAVVLRDLLILLPVFIYWYFADRQKMPLYGFTLKNYDTKPYLIMLAIMLPLVVLASFQLDFLSQYPKGFSLFPLSMDIPAERKYFFIYEFFYGIDFIFIEFFFRGFLLLAFYRHFGWGCLLPMACFYVTIHFGKPLGETISSFFGGTILGILAIRTGSIAGGIIVHMGIAWLMEFAALMHKIL